MANNKKSTRFTTVENPRNKTITFYLTLEELEQVKQQVSGLNGMTVSKYCRLSILGRKIVSDSDTKLIYELTRLGGVISKLGGLQKQLFNFSPAGEMYSQRTLKVLKDIGLTLFEITMLVKRVKTPSLNSEIKMGG